MEYRSSIGLQTLSGTPTSVEPSSDFIQSDDLFLISQPCNLNVGSGNYFSENISYAQLSAKIFEDIKNRFPFKDMAYVDKDQYSRIGHKHVEYNKIAIQPENAAANDRTVNIAKLVIDGNAITISMKRPIEKTLPDPAPGQLKFMALQKYEDSSFALSAFPGWVWADGSRYLKKDYDLYDYFESVSDEEFAVPNINNMLQINNKPYDGVNTEQIEAENQIGQHSHTINLRMSGKVEGKIKYTLSNVGAGSGTHGSSNKQTGKVAFSSKIKFDEVKIDGDASFSKCDDDGKQTLPTRMTIPTLVYIGKKNK